MSETEFGTPPLITERGTRLLFHLPPGVHYMSQEYVLAAPVVDLILPRDLAIVGLSYSQSGHPSLLTIGPYGIEGVDVIKRTFIVQQGDGVAMGKCALLGVLDPPVPSDPISMVFPGPRWWVFERFEG